MPAVKIAVKQKQVELALRAESMKNHQGIEAGRLRLKQQEQLQLEEYLAVSEAQADMLERLETTSSKSRSVQSVNSDCRSKEVHRIIRNKGGR